MKKVALALLVLLTISSVSFAGYTPIITEVDNGVDGVRTFVIGIHDDADGISSVSDIVCDGNVGQVWGYGGYAPTPTAAKLVETGVPAAQWVLDTYLLDIGALSTTSQGMSQEGSVLWETLNGAPPAVAGSSFGDIGMDIMTASGPGDGSGTGIGTYAIKNPAPGLNDLEFMQVVVADNESVTISGKYTNPTVAGAGGAMMPFSITVPPVPEPSTIALLICGALGLIAIRRRK